MASSQGRARQRRARDMSQLMLPRSFGPRLQEDPQEEEVFTGGLTMALETMGVSQLISNSQQHCGSFRTGVHIAPRCCCALHSVLFCSVLLTTVLLYATSQSSSHSSHHLLAAGCCLLSPVSCLLPAVSCLVAAVCCLLPANC